MTKTRTKHMGLGITMLERLDDSTLSECFNGASVADARAYLKELREQGYEVVPCNCGNYDAKGHCIGTTKDTSATGDNKVTKE